MVAGHAVQQHFEHPTQDALLGLRHGHRLQRKPKLHEKNKAPVSLCVWDRAKSSDQKPFAWGNYPLSWACQPPGEEPWEKQVGWGFSVPSEALSFGDVVLLEGKPIAGLWLGSSGTEYSPWDSWVSLQIRGGFGKHGPACSQPMPRFICTEIRGQSEYRSRRLTWNPVI